MSKSKIQMLNLFLDEKGVLRAGGRLRNSDLPFAKAHPIILGPHYLTTLFIRSIHQKTFHGGPQLMLRVIRQNYWIIRARNQVRFCVHKCVICVRHRAAPCTQRPGRGKKTRKAWLAIFVCFVSRAIHIETVSDCSTVAFIAAFKRFTSIYGMPSLMMSDNGTNFQGAERELRQAFEEVKTIKI